ncbi:hypothetical protein BH20VER1_BH20VER1_30490 [soil metagenome]
MNQPLFLHIVERLEGFLGKLPERIQKPILQELTPMKELFLKQRPPRLVLTGSHKLPVQELVTTLFTARQGDDLRDVLMEVYRWHTVNVGGHGMVELLDARGGDETALRQVREELERQPADIFLHLVDGSSARPVLVREIESLASLSIIGTTHGPRKVIGLSLVSGGRGSDGGPNGKSVAAADRTAARAKLETALSEHPVLGGAVVQVLELPVVPMPRPEMAPSAASARLMMLLVRELPNEARVEMIRVSRDLAAQEEIANVLVKSTSAVCTAIGAQPIPLADLPILTTLQLVMVSGIMHIAGRDRSLRAATEFAAALGVNVGAGMVLREGARAVLKFFPGWGNVVCGMVAGAGTYALGKAATAYFLHGVSLHDARRTFAQFRRKSRREKLIPVLTEGGEKRGRR